jgi:hypothetical protein
MEGNVELILDIFVDSAIGDLRVEREKFFLFRSFKERECVLGKIFR